MLTGRQVSEARALVGLSQAGLAEVAGVALALIIYAESENGVLTVTKRDALSIRFALEDLGVEFVAGAAGVRLRGC